MDVSTTPVVQYTYSSPSNGSRLASMVYPNGRAINYNYSGANTNGALDNAIGRLDSISDSANSGDAGQVLEQYSYLGLSTIVARNHPQTGINLALLGSAGSIGSGGDQYVGLDQFGRVVNQNWVNSATGASVDNYTYTYDQNSNVTAKNNVLNSTYSETYSYDLLNRLTAAARGGAAYQSWNLDSQGNWSSSTTDGTTQTQTANAQNQITSISGTAGTPVYDANGNMTTNQNGDTLTYDAWNRLVKVTNASGQIIAQYTYNAMGYRITEAYPQGGAGIPAGEVNYIYYNSNWQAIETRTNGTAAGDVASQTVWSAAYINAAVLQDTYSAGVIQPGSRTYFLQDANWDTTAIVGYNGTAGTWGVTQRYVYSPYGTITVLNADWSTPPTGTQPGVSNLYQGMTLDSVIGLYDERFRNYSPELGTWISQDPAGYINGANTYQYVQSSPAGNVDPAGWARADIAQVNKLASEAGLTPEQRQELGDEIHNYKEGELMQPNKNMTSKQIMELIEEIKEGRGKGGSGPGANCPNKKPKWDGKRGGRRGFDTKNMAKKQPAGGGSVAGTVSAIGLALGGHDLANSFAGQLVGGAVQLGKTVAGIPGDIASAAGNAWAGVSNFFSGPSEAAPSAIAEPVAPDEAMIPAE